ncbi:hypothetical protein FRB98_007565 [Tulasnella sp. 332]|nr:hypothetical protein FRB98_007565 [Tulasnella sp. 332]
MAPATPWKAGRYPTSQRSDHIDTYKSKAQGEVRVADPYQWLEENSKETEQWVDEQEAFTQEYLAPSLKYDDRWYWYYNSGLSAQSIIYRSKDATLPKFDLDGSQGPEDAGEIFFDPNLLTEDGTGALTTTAFSRCGKYFAYGVSLSGSDFFTIYVRSTDSPFNSRPEKGLADTTGRLGDVIRYCKFSGITWTHDSKGFFYQTFGKGKGPLIALDTHFQRLPAREEHGDLNSDAAGTETTGDKNAMIYYHRLGTQQSEDTLVFQDKQNPTYLFSLGVSEVDGKYLELYTSKDTDPVRELRSPSCALFLIHPSFDIKINKLWIADLHENEIGPNIKWHKVVDDFKASYTIVANNDRHFFAITNKDASRKKVVTFTLPNHAEWKLEALDVDFKEFIPEDANGGILEDFGPVNDTAFLAHYSRDVHDKLYLVSSDGVIGEQLDPNFVGTLSASYKRDKSFFFVTFSGFNNPGIIKRYDFPNAGSDVTEGATWETWRKTFLKGLVPDEFSAEQVWYDSKDGTRVPMFIVKHKNTPRDGTAPVIQYGYGGFSISQTPFFSPSMLTFIKGYGGVLALPGIRGGGEFGEDWHLAGVREKRVKVYEDFIAATKYLVDHKHGAPGKVAINGGSNGGTLVAACVNRAPEGTFGAAVAEVGVLDLLKFAQFTIGYAWTGDFGDPAVPGDFDFIYKYSPLHNIPTGQVLPPMILLTADHDDRVVPLHSFKHAATLQHIASHNPHPLLIRIDKKAGHGAGKSTEKKIQEAADKWGFVAQSLGLEWKS